jgi:hypothetical protein
MSAVASPISFEPERDGVADGRIDLPHGAGLQLRHPFVDLSLKGTDAVGCTAREHLDRHLALFLCINSGARPQAVSAGA